MKNLTEYDFKINCQVYIRMGALGNPNFWFGNHKIENYERLIKITEFADASLEGASCIDVGCGTGDFSEVLRKKGIKSYLGVDIFKPSIELAREKHPNEKFILADILSWKPDEKFEFVFCSGALTTRLHSNNYDFIGSMIRKMWDISSIGISFNFLTDTTELIDRSLFLYSHQKVIGMCKDIVKPDGYVFYRVIDHEAHVYMYRKKHHQDL